MSTLHFHGHRILQAAIEAVKPANLMSRKIFLDGDILEIGNTRFDLGKYENIYLIGAGKASSQMAHEMEIILGDRISGGMVITKYDHTMPCKKTEVLEAGHPVVDENGIAGTSRILEFLAGAGEKDLVFCLLSGGGSALLENLPDGIPLADIRKVFELLLGCGANIDEVNTVRKHLSLVKGGQLARAIAPAACVSVILSDVIGDPLDLIASGPTAPDTSTFEDAWEIVQKYRMEERLPLPVKHYLRRGCEGDIADTLRENDPVFNNVVNIILGNNMEALLAAQREAEGMGYCALILSSRLQGEAREVAKMLASVVQEIQVCDLPVPKPACIIMGGETTVTLRGAGKGGRNQELVMAALMSLGKVRDDYLVCSCGSDGTDGPTDAAGGMATPLNLRKALSEKLDPRVFLDNNDAYPFLEKSGALLKTGPTGTNVMDIIFALVP